MMQPLWMSLHGVPMTNHDIRVISTLKCTKSDPNPNLGLDSAADTYSRPRAAAPYAYRPRAAAPYASTYSYYYEIRTYSSGQYVRRYIPY